MKILVVHNFYKQSAGEDALVTAEVELLNKGGHEAKLYSTDNVTIHSLRTKIMTLLKCVYNRKARTNLALEIRNFDPEIVHVHNFFPLLSPSIFDACQDAGVPSVMTLHNFRILCPTATLFHAGATVEKSLTHSSWWTVPKRVYRDSLVGTLALACLVEFHKRRGTWQTKVDRFIALSGFAREKFIAGGLPAAKVVVKSNWTWPRPDRRTRGAVRGALFVGRLSEEKGLRVLLEAWRSIDYPLTIVGDGPLAGWLASEVNPRIRILGRLEPSNVLKQMDSSAFLVMPSLWSEMFPMTLVEAFASSLPVVCSKIGSMAEIVEDGATGLRFEAGNADALVETVRWAIDNPREMQQLGENARARYEERFAPRTNLEALVSIYRETINDAATRELACTRFG